MAIGGELMMFHGRHKSGQDFLVARHLNNRSGGAVLMVLMMTPLIFAFLQITLQFTQKSLIENKRIAIKSELMNYASIVRLSLFRKDLCAASIGPVKITDSGGNLKERVDVVVRYPDTSVSSLENRSILLGPQEKLSVAKTHAVTMVAFNPIRNVPNAFLAYLNFDGMTSDTFITQPITVPIYVITDASGTLTGCKATRFSTAESKVTMQDAICSTRHGANFYYNPVTDLCRN